MMTLSEAPVGAGLKINHIANDELAVRLAKLGLYPGSSIVHLPDNVNIGPVKVTGLKGDLVLSGWLASYVVVHRDDDRRLPLPECKAGESGHVEGISGRALIEDSLRELGIIEGERITFLRHLPPMSYHVTVNEKTNVSFSESIAAHIMGKTASGAIQFSSAGKDEIFTVSAILPGNNVDSYLSELSIFPGTRLSLNSVSTGQNIKISSNAAIACTTSSGLSLFLQESDASSIYVKLRSAHVHIGNV